MWKVLGGEDALHHVNNSCIKLCDFGCNGGIVISYDELNVGVFKTCFSLRYSPFYLFWLNFIKIGNVVCKSCLLLKTRQKVIEKQNITEVEANNLMDYVLQKSMISIFQIIKK